MTISQKIWYTQRLNSDVGSECDDNCYFQLSMPLVITMNISIIVGRMGLSSLQECIAAICILHTDHLLIVWMSTLELTDTLKLNAYKNL